MIRTFFIVLTFLCITAVKGQDTLPKFNAKIKSGRVILSWTNLYQDVVNINIQRSRDSLKGFMTILNVADPKSITNGYLDARAPDTLQYYRIFVQRSGGTYFFTKSKRPFGESPKQTANLSSQTNLISFDESRNTSKKDSTAEKKSSIEILSKARTESTLQLENSRGIQSATTKKNDINITPVKDKNQEIRKEQNDIKLTSKLIPSFPVALNEEEYQPSRFNAFSSPIFLKKYPDIPDRLTLPRLKGPSPTAISGLIMYLYVNETGHLTLALRDDKTKTYTLRFFQDDGRPMFSLIRIRENYLIIDKTNFLRSGWYRYELLINNQVAVKNRFFIPADR